MSELVFKTLTYNESSRSYVVRDLSPAQSCKVEDYRRALVCAAESEVAQPCFSHYVCKEGVLQKGGGAVAAGNIEYGFLQALHGEESAVAALRSRASRQDGEEIILGIYSDQMCKTLSDNPCGNCRDIMREDFGESLEIVSGRPDGKEALVVQLQYLLFDRYRQASIDRNLRDTVVETVSQGERLENDAYSTTDLHRRRKYYVRLKTTSGTFFGAHDVMCDYHPIYAIRDAIRQAIRQHDVLMTEVLVVCEDPDGNPPDVMYKDRQHLLEFNLQQELVLGEEQDPPVFLASYSRDEKGSACLQRVWQTSVKEWLPFPFTAREFMDLEKLSNYFQRFSA